MRGATDCSVREQLVGIVLDRRDAVAREQVGEEPHHDLAVLQHVGDAGGRAGVVLQHVERVGVDAHDVDAGDVHVDVVRHRLAGHLRPEDRVAEDQVVGHDPGPQDLARAVDVVEEGVDRLDALLEAARSRSHSAADRMRGMTSNGISRSWASASP